MNPFLAIIKDRCFIDGSPDGGLDIRVLYFLATDKSDVARQIEAESRQPYLNDQGGSVLWKLDEIIAIEPFENPKSGEEVIGFITDEDLQ